MLITQLPSAGTQTPIDGDAFGANVLFYWQNIGDEQGHFVVDEIVEKTNISFLRYPGGGVTEDRFDITNPNASFVDTNGNGQRDLGEKFLLAQDRFLEYCAQNDIAASIVIPTSGPTITVTRNPENADNFFADFAVDEKWESDIRAYLDALLADAHKFGATLELLEIGNEFYGVDYNVIYPSGIEHISKSVIYGVVANELAKIAQEAINNFRTMHQLGSDWIEPSIAVQAVGPISHVGDPALERWTLETVQKQFDPTAIAAIDAVIAHHYHLDSETFTGIDDAIAFGGTLMDAWDNLATKPLERYVTEWNILTDAEDRLGLRQVAPVLQIFSEYQRMGVEGMMFWPMQFHEIGLGEWDGKDGANLNLIGEFFQLMNVELTGTVALETQHDSKDVSVNAFLAADHATIFIASLQEGRVQIDLTESMPGISFTSLTILSAGLDPETQSEILVKTEIDTGNPISDFVLNNREVAFIEVPLRLSGGSGDDILLDGTFTTFFNAGSGDDLIKLSNGLNIVRADDGNDFVVMSFNSNYESNSSAKLSAAMRNIVFAGNGDDTITSLEGISAIYAEDGDDIIVSNGTRDLLDGGYGDDRIQVSGVGNNWIVGGRGNDFLTGGDGADIFIFTPYDGGDVIGKMNALPLADPNPLMIYDWNCVLEDWRYEAYQNFVPGIDKIALSGFHNSINAENLMGFITDTPLGASFFASSTRILLVGVKAEDLSLSDFILTGTTGRGFKHSLDRYGADGWDYWVAEEIPEDFFVSPDSDGTPRWKETIMDFDPYGGDHIWIEDARIESAEQLSVADETLNGIMGVEIGYGNGSVFLAGHSALEIGMVTDSILTLL